MALDAGTVDATSGLAGAIYTVMNEQLSEGIPAENLPAIQAGWKKLSYAVAAGVVSGLTKEAPPPPDGSFAETFSSVAEDAAFWNWLSSFASAFRNWTPTTPDGTTLKNALNPLVQVGAVPSKLQGIVR